MSAEKERRYQELYKNRFVNPIDHGVGRRTGWVLGKEARKDSEGFELFDDYWSDSGDESIDDLSLHANKENNARQYKLSSPIQHMPAFTPSSRGSTDAEPLSDVGSKTLTSNSTLTKPSHAAPLAVESVDTKCGQAEDDPLPTEMQNGTASQDEATGVAMPTPPRDEGAIQESDITGSIIKGGSSFQVPKSALQEFKTKTRLSFGSDDDDSQRKKSTRRKSSNREDKSSVNDDGDASDATIKAAQSDMESDGHGTAQDELSAGMVLSLVAATQKASSEDKLSASVVVQKSLPEPEEKTLPLTEDTTASAVEKNSDKEQMGSVVKEDSSKEASDKNMTATKDSVTMTRKSARKSTSQKTSASLNQTTSNGHKEAVAEATKPTRRKRRNLTHMEEDTPTSGDEGMFVSLQKSFIRRRDRTKETVSDGTDNQSFQDADDEEIIDIVDNDRKYYKSTSKKKAKNRETSKEAGPKSAVDKLEEVVSEPRRQKGRAKVGKEEAPKKDFVDIISDEDESRPSEEMDKPLKGKPSTKGESSEESEPDAKKSKQSRSSRSLRSRRFNRTAGSEATRGARGKSDSGKDSGKAESDGDTKKGNRSRRQATKKAEQNSAAARGSDEMSSTGTDEEQGRTKSGLRKSRPVTAAEEIGESSKGSRGEDLDLDQDSEDSKPARTRRRPVRGKGGSHSLQTEPQNVEAGTECETAVSDVNDARDGALSNTAHQEQLPSAAKPAPSSSRKSKARKRVSVHFSNVEVISDATPIPLDDGEHAETTQTPRGIPSLPPQQTSLSDADEDGCSSKKKFRRTPGAKLMSRYPISGRSARSEVNPSEQAGKRTVESSREDTVDTKRRRGSSSVTRGRSKGGKRKLYSGDLPSSFLNDPSLTGPPSANTLTNGHPATSPDLGDSPKASSGSKGEPEDVAAKEDVPARGRAQARGRGKARARGSTRKIQANKKAPTEIQEPDDIVLDFLTKYESGKESESTDSEDRPTTVETSQEEIGAVSGSADTPGDMCTTVYPEPTPRSIMKGSATNGANAQKKNLTLQFFEVPKQKAIIVPPDQAGNGQRRTKRNRVRPVEFWRNERPQYQRRKSGGFVLVGVQSPALSTPEQQTQPRRQMGRGKRKLPQTPANLSMHVSPPPGGKVAEHPAMVVVNPDTQEEVEVDTLKTSKMYNFVGPSGKEATAEDPITLCKCITQKAFSSGILTIRPLCEKGMQFVQNDTMVFYINRGKVSVTIHHTTSIMQNGDMFFVPQGNMYNIKNLRRDEAKLVFFQHKGR